MLGKYFEAFNPRNHELTLPVRPGARPLITCPRIANLDNSLFIAVEFLYLKRQYQHNKSIGKLPQYETT